MKRESKQNKDIYDPFSEKKRVSSLNKYKSPRLCDLPNFDYRLENITPNKTSLGSKSTVDWLKKRHKATCRIIYLKSRKSRKVENLLQEMFNLVDIDNSGTIDIGELYSIFKFNKYNISRKSFNKFFSKVPFQQMNFEEFKSLCSPDGEMRAKFVEMIKEAKATSTTNFFPKKFEYLIKHLKDSSQRYRLLNQISDPKITIQPEKDCKLFKDVFGLNQCDLSEYRSKNADKLHDIINKRSKSVNEVDHASIVKERLRESQSTQQTATELIDKKLQKSERVFNLQKVSPLNDSSEVLPSKKSSTMNLESEKNSLVIQSQNTTQNSSILESLKSQGVFPKLQNIK